MRGGLGALALGIGLSLMPTNLEAAVILKQAEAHRPTYFSVVLNEGLSPESLFEKYNPRLDKGLELIEQGYQKSVANIERHYASHLVVLARQEQKKGNLEGVLAIGGEIERMKLEGLEDAELSEDIYEMASRHVSGIESRKNERYSQSIATVDRWAEWMESFQRSYTVAGKIDEACQVRDEIERIKQRRSHLEAKRYFDDRLPKDSPTRLQLNGKQNTNLVETKTLVSDSARERTEAPCSVENIRFDGTRREGAILNVNPGSVRGGELEFKFRRGFFSNLDIRDETYLRFHVPEGRYWETGDTIVFSLIDGETESVVGKINGVKGGWHELYIPSERIISSLKKSQGDIRIDIDLEDTDGQAGLNGVGISSFETGNGPGMIIREK